MQHHVGKHIRLEQAVAVVEFQPHLVGARLRIEVGIDVGDLALEHAAGQRNQPHLGHIAHAHPGQLVFVDVHVGPDARQIGDGVELRGRRHMAAFARAHLEHDARRRRVDVQRLHDLPRALQLANLVRRHVQQLQPLARRAQQVERALAHVREGAVLQRFRVLQRQQVFLLAGHELRRIDGEQHRVRFHRRARVAHEHLFHPAGHLRVQAGEPLLVIGDAAGGLDQSRDGALLGPGRAHADGLHHGGVDHHRSGRGAAAAIQVLGIDGDVVHAHLVLGRHRRGDARVHRIAVEQRLALGFGLRAGAGCRALAGQPVARANAGKQHGQDDETVFHLHGFCSCGVDGCTAWPMAASRRAQACQAWLVASQ